MRTTLIAFRTIKRLPKPSMEGNSVYTLGKKKPSSELTPLDVPPGMDPDDFALDS